DLSRKNYHISPIIDNVKCSSCFARYYCGGGCKHDNLSSCGSIAAPSEDMCRLRCRELELAGYIVSNLNSDNQAFLMKQDIFPPKPCPLDF
ncbi:MAG: nif11-like peptide radical SAM maturase, partial [Bacillota bacterium]|nr:nif11-like peptide radical SAM maturase [Bacillota bacterium]